MSQPDDTRPAVAHAADTRGAERLDRAIDELERAAGALRSGDLDAAEAASVVERCAELAGEVASALEREIRAARQAAPPGQETLL